MPSKNTLENIVTEEKIKTAKIRFTLDNPKKFKEELK